MKTVGNFSKEARQLLENGYDPSEAEHIVGLLLEEVTGLTRTDIRTRSAEFLKDEDEKKLDNYLDQLKQQKPLQYVLGYAWFCGMKFQVDENVLIPRPETEELVEWIVNLEKDQDSSRKLTVIDIGTGSGCIAISLAKKLYADVHAIDISPGALKVAAENARANDAQVLFLEKDILAPDFKLHQEKYDVIASNPPYIRRNEMEAMSANVKNFEPHTALFVNDNDPLLFYKRIAAFAKIYLEPGGRLYVEINAAMGHEVKELLQRSEFKRVEVKKDLSGNDRMVRAVF